MTHTPKRNLIRATHSTTLNPVQKYYRNIHFSRKFLSISGNFDRNDWHLWSECHNLSAERICVRVEVILRGNCTSNPNWTSFLCYFKIINTFLEIDMKHPEANFLRNSIMELKFRLAQEGFFFFFFFFWVIDKDAKYYFKSISEDPTCYMK